MRTKRFLSLLLAVAMLAGLTISASAATEVIFYEDFATSDGEAGTWLSENTWSFGAGSHSLQLALDSYYDAEKANGRPFMTRSSNGGNPSAGKSLMITNTNGLAAFSPLGKSGGSTQGASLWVIPSKGYNLVENEGKALVFSVEAQFDPTAQTQNQKMTSYWNGYFVDADATDSSFTSSSSNQFYSIIGTATDVDTNAEDDVHDYQTTGLTLSMYQHLSTNAALRTYSMAEGAAYPLTLNEAHRLAVSYHYDSSRKYPIAKTFAWDGDYVGRSTASSDNGLTVEKPIVRAFDLQYNYPIGMSYANLKIYAIDMAAGSFNVSTTAGDVVATSARTIPVKFSQPVAPENFDATAVTVTRNSEALTYGEDFTVSGLTQFVGDVGGEAYSTANVTFMDRLEDSSDYVITFSEEITNEIGTKLADYNTIEFSTPEPDIKIEGFDVVKGFGTEAEAIADGFTADGTLQGASIKLTNNTDASKNVAVIYAVYSSAGQLTDVVYTDSSVAARVTDTFETGVKLSEAGTVKAFIWDGLNSLKPHTGSTVKTIAAE